MKKTYITLALAFICVLCSARTAVPQTFKLPYLPAQMKGAGIAVMAVDSEGNVLADYDSDKLMVPASNLKLVTTGVALHHFGGDYRFKTGIAYCGSLEGNTLDGDVYVVGGADPTLGSLDSVATPVQQTFAAWKKALNDAGIRHVKGHVIGDGSYVDGMLENPKWQWEDIGTYYGCGVSGLNFCENVFRLHVMPGASVGAPLDIKPGYPSLPWLDIRYECCTGEKGTGDQLYLYDTDMGKAAVLRGTFALAHNAKNVKCANKFPEYTCAGEFSKYLSGCLLDNAGPGEYVAPSSDLVKVGQTYSPALSRIAYVCNRDSNNLYAETMMRTLGREMTGSACYDSSAVAVGNVLRDLGLNDSNVRIVDGSGLSRSNFVSPSFMCRFLGAMMDSPAWNDFYGSIPQVGVSGTVRGRLPKLPSEQRQRVRMKSGSMAGVLCFSGYFVSQQGRTVIFSVMINNCLAPEGMMYAWADEVITRITGL